MVSPDDAMGADTAFSYRCTRCNSCCVDKRIQVNPYEIARLARHRGLSTGDLRDRFTVDGALRQEADGRCAFLGEQGCTVHADRPLVCRLFPLGRVVNSDGTERFVRFPDPHAAHGLFGSDGTIADYLATQGAAPFIAAADAYFQFYCRASERLANDEAPVADTDGSDLLDIDSQLAAYCREQQIEEPADPDERMRLHIRILDAFLGE